MPETSHDNTSGRRPLRWILSRPSYVLLSGEAAGVPLATPSAYARAWAGLMLLSLGWGGVWVGLWGGAWRLVARSDVLFAPVAVVLGVMLLGPYRRAVTALVGLIVGNEPTERMTGTAALVAVVALALLALRADPYHHELSLPTPLAWLRPTFEAQRVLLLMPVWGAWAMLISVQFARPSPAAGAAVTAFARGCGPVAAVLALTVPGGLTWLYFHFLGGWELALIGAVVIAAVAAGPLAARRTGGLTHDALRGANVAVQVVFILAYLAVI